jgi:hypothetical protein
MGERIYRILLNLFRRRLKLLIFVCVALFLINVYVICSYFQLYTIKTEVSFFRLLIPCSTFQNTNLPFEGKELAKRQGSELQPNVIRVPRCTFTETLADSAFSRMKTEECRRELENAYCDMDPVGWPVLAINNTCPAYGLFQIV